MIQKIRISHNTSYKYSEPVSFGVHCILIRPREGHDVRIISATLEVQPDATIRWVRDVEGNSVARATFASPSDLLRINAQIDVELYDDPTIECLIDENARSYPFQYSPDEQVELISYRLPSYPYDGPVLH